MPSFDKTVVQQVQQLFVLYAKKGAFTLEEYSDVGTVYKHVQEALASDEHTLTDDDVKFVLTAINICSQRTAVEVQNYKLIASLFETLGESIKHILVEEESKE